ncbi:RNA polymerase sigma factor [Actinomadura sp. NTSP31]|uniref:RNA polymerase sigma factor n=1 Tax=Actinomadura sp. NTSP31 TaxID=1735447 RepID=UPI0035C11D02
MTTDPDDAELIARSLGGDVDAFMEVVRRHEAAVGAYLVRRVGREAAEDLLGEVWVAALGSRASYDRSFPDARPWLFAWRTTCSCGPGPAALPDAQATIAMSQLRTQPAAREAQEVQDPPLPDGPFLVLPRI